MKLLKVDTDTYIVLENIKIFKKVTYEEKPGIKFYMGGSLENVVYYNKEETRDRYFNKVVQELSKWNKIL